MSKAENKALEAYPVLFSERHGYDDTFKDRRESYIKGYQQAEKDVAESFARIIRGNLSMIDKSVQDKFEHLYTEITCEKMYKGFND